MAALFAEPRRHTITASSSYTNPNKSTNLFNPAYTTVFAFPFPLPFLFRPQFMALSLFLTFSRPARPLDFETRPPISVAQPELACIYAMREQFSAELHRRFPRHLVTEARKASLVEIGREEPARRFPEGREESDQVRIGHSSSMRFELPGTMLVNFISLGVWVGRSNIHEVLTVAQYNAKNVP